MESVKVALSVASVTVQTMFTDDCAQPSSRMPPNSINSPWCPCILWLSGGIHSQTSADGLSFDGTVIDLLGELIDHKAELSLNEDRHSSSR